MDWSVWSSVPILVIACASALVVNASVLSPLPVGHHRLVFVMLHIDAGREPIVLRGCWFRYRRVLVHSSRSRSLMTRDVQCTIPASCWGR